MSHCQSGVKSNFINLLPGVLILLSVYCLLLFLFHRLGWILHFFLPGIAVYFDGLRDASLTWHPLCLILLIAAGLSISWWLSHFRKKGLYLTLLAVLVFVSALLTVRINGIPFLTVIRTVKALLAGGVL